MKERELKFRMLEKKFEMLLEEYKKVLSSIVLLFILLVSVLSITVSQVQFSGEKILRISISEKGKLYFCGHPRDCIRYKQK